MSDGNVKYFKLYKERDGKSTTYYIPVRENKSQWAVEGFVWNQSWDFRPHLVNPDDWNERTYGEDAYLKLVPMTEVPNKRQLIRLWWEMND